MTLEEDSKEERRDLYGLKPLEGPTEDLAELDPRAPDIPAVHEIDGNAWETWKHDDRRLLLKDSCRRQDPGARIYPSRYRAGVAFTHGHGDLKGLQGRYLRG